MRRECLAIEIVRHLRSNDVLLSREIFYTLEEARVLIERWRRSYNQVRPHSSLGYRPPGAGDNRTGKDRSSLRYCGATAPSALPSATARINITADTNFGRRSFLQCCVLLSILLGAFGGPAVAKNTVLRCQGYQPDDRHKLTEEIITLDMQNNIAISIQLDGIQPKDVINAPIKNASKDVLEWSYDAVGMKYFFNKQSLRLRLFTDTMILLGIFDCTMS